MDWATGAFARPRAAVLVVVGSWVNGGAAAIGLAGVAALAAGAEDAP